MTTEERFHAAVNVIRGLPKNGKKVHVKVKNIQAHRTLLIMYNYTMKENRVNNRVISMILML